MNTNIALLLALALATLAANAQGPLTPPPGAPAPGMKSLDQIEARTPVNTLAGDGTAKHIISAPGSYYLTGPIAGESGKDGIHISAANVTLDLNGFALTGIGGSKTAITLTIGASPVTIRNGSLQSWTTGGIIGLSATHVTIEDLAITGISAGPGVTLNAHSLARRISVNGSQRAGINLVGTSGIVSECTVENLGCQSWSLNPLQENVYGISAGVISNSSVRNISGASGTADTVYGIKGNLVEHCIAGDFPLPGYLTFGIHASTVRTCEVFNVSCGSSPLVGIRGSIIEGNTLHDLTGSDKIGISPLSSEAVILNNHLNGCSIESGASTIISGNRVTEVGGKTAISVQLSGCKVTGNTISVANGSGSLGIDVKGSGHQISGNVITTGTGGIAILAEASRCKISENTINVTMDPPARGIYIPSGYSNNRIDNNTVTGGNYGIIIAGGNNHIATRNSVAGATTAYSISVGTQTGPFVSLDDLTAASPWANLSQP